MIIVGLIGLLAAIALPAYRKARGEAQAQICVENLNKIDQAKEMWALEKGKSRGEPVAISDLVGPAAFFRHLPQCPARGIYDFTTVGTPPECSQGSTLNHKW